jgi:predicted DNA-binding transcriptional regulator AlpA
MEAACMQENKPTDLIRVAEARKLLGVSRIKIAELIRDGHIRHFPYPIDKRVKLVSQAEVLALRVRDQAA